jgi:2-dehydro-3-deoxyphosphooctonate aldolase (KDO 8-P synthase)
MFQKTIKIAHIDLSNSLPLVFMAGVNVLDDPSIVDEVAKESIAICRALGMPYIFKASFDKANRTSLNSFRGPGLDKGLQWLADIKSRFNLPILTDIHESNQAAIVAEVADVLQIPAFLCRQTDLIVAAAKTQKPIQIKKAQFLAAEDMIHIANKCMAAGNDQVIFCERGTCFGYHNLIVDFLGFSQMKQTGFPLVFDATHALQKPGGQGHAADGRGAQVLELAKAGVVQSIAGLFLEMHPDPSKAKCDGPCALPLNQLKPFLEQIKSLDDWAKSQSDLVF